MKVDDFKWFGKPRSCQNSQQGDRGVGLLVKECLIEEVGCITNVNFEKYTDQNLGRQAFFVGCYTC